MPANTLRERKKAKTREKIVSVALRLFADDGYANTTIARIAEGNAEDIDREIATDNQRADELGLVFDSDPRNDASRKHASVEPGFEDNQDT